MISTVLRYQAISSWGTGATLKLQARKALLPAPEATARPWFERLTDEENNWLQAGVADSEGDHVRAEQLYSLDAEFCEAQNQPARAALSSAFAARSCEDPERRLRLLARAAAAFESAASIALRDNPWLAYQFLGSAGQCHALAENVDESRRIQSRQLVLRETIDPS